MCYLTTQGKASTRFRWVVLLFHMKLVGSVVIWRLNWAGFSRKAPFPSLDIGVGFLHWPPFSSWPFHMARLNYSHGVVCFLRETVSQKKEVEAVSLYVLVSKLSGLSLHFCWMKQSQYQHRLRRRGIAQWGSGHVQAAGVRSWWWPSLETSTTVWLPWCTSVRLVRSSLSTSLPSSSDVMERTKAWASRSHWIFEKNRN